MTSVDIAFVGEGAAGLAAATAVRDAGLDYLVLDAKDRIGGRRLERWPEYPWRKLPRETRFCGRSASFSQARPRAIVFRGQGGVAAAYSACHGVHKIRIAQARAAIAVCR